MSSIPTTEQARLGGQIGLQLRLPTYNSSPQKVALELEELREYLRVFNYPTNHAPFRLGPVASSQHTFHEFLRHQPATPGMRGDGSPHHRPGMVEGHERPFWVTWFRIVGYEPGRPGGLAYELRFRPFRDAHSVPATLHPPDPTIRAATSFKFPPSSTQWQLLTPLHHRAALDQLALSDPSQASRGSPVSAHERQRLQLAVSLELKARGSRSAHPPSTRPATSPGSSPAADHDNVHRELDELARYLSRYRCPDPEDTSEPGSPPRALSPEVSSPGRASSEELRWGGPNHPAFDEPHAF